MIGGAHSPLVIKVYGDDLRELRRISQQMVDVLYTVRGTSSASIFQEPPIPQINITVDRDKARALWAQHRRHPERHPDRGGPGAGSSTVYVGDASYNLTVRFIGAQPRSPEALANLPVHTASGMQVPLSQVADIRVQMGESTITRENGKRNLTIRIDNRDRDISGYLAEAQAKIGSHVHFDPDKVRLDGAASSRTSGERWRG